MSTSIETAPNPETAEPANPFLQFVDPRRYRELVEFANKHTEPGRLICPLSHPGPRPTKAPIDRATGLRGR
jgi:hypothetical protein